jgi:preprotein translocase SecE subunit
METNPVGWVQGARDYVGGVQGEYQKITWPPQEEAVAGTIGVTAVVAVVTTALGFVDFLLSRIMQYLLS